MNPYDDYADYAAIPVPPPPLGAPSRRRHWLVIGALALAMALMLGVGVFVGATMLSTAQAAANIPGVAGAANIAQFSLANTPGAQRPGSGIPGGQGQCDALTVSSVSGATIIAKAADGSSVTIHTTASTKYIQHGQSAAASAVKAGSQIHVSGAHNSDGSITATQIAIR